jgi:hypothetical protein
MSRVLTFEYDRAYNPVAPKIDVSVDGYVAGQYSVLSAFVDSGADGTMLPENVLFSIDAEYADTLSLRGMAAGTQRVDRYTVRIRIAEYEVHAIAAVAIAAGSEPIIGRDVLNELVILLNGPAGVTEVTLP